MGQDKSEIRSEKQNAQQPRAVQIGEALMVKRDEKCAIRTFLQKSSGGQALRSFQRFIANDWLEIIQPVVTEGKKMLETKNLRLQGHNG